jgi:hypothetical protein
MNNIEIAERTIASLADKSALRRALRQIGSVGSDRPCHFSSPNSRDASSPAPWRW